MALFDLADPSVPLPTQFILDSSLLLACRAEDDNPLAHAAKQFVKRMEERIAAYQMIAWLPAPVLQECYHVILSRGLRRAWETQPREDRRPNWLAAYKNQPNLLAVGFDDMAKFDEILAAIPVTPVLVQDLPKSTGTFSLHDRMRHYIATYNLLPQDALILAETEQLGVMAVATLDSDWRRVDEFDVYTTPIR
jgi:predicted nucleic acid-binding protein